MPADGDDTPVLPVYDGPTFQAGANMHEPQDFRPGAGADALPWQGIEEIACIVSSSAGQRLDLSSFRPIQRPEGKSDVADATLALLVDGETHAGDVVVLVSPPGHPEVVAEAVTKIDEIGAHLAETTLARALRPVAEGRVLGRSFAAFPRLSPIPEGGIRGRLEARIVASAARAWLIDVARESRRDVLAPARQGLFSLPLQTLAEDTDLPDSLRRAAEARLGRVAEAGLFTIVGHGDFWIGNLLFPRGVPGAISAARGDFRVIDWRGAQTDGYPFADLARFALSIRRPGATASGRALEAYRQALDIPREEVGLYALAAVGRGGMALDHFPRPRYLALARRLFEFFRIHGYLS